MKLGIISLGCAKNKVDTELFLGVAKKYNFEITNSLVEADVIVVNTCGFIESAKQEAIDTILEVLDYKKDKVKIVVIGCLVERYKDDLIKAIPEVDFYFPIRDYKNIDELFKKLTNSEKSYKFDYTNRVLTTAKETVYIRIAEGCDNKCAYCAIPLIRGPFVSRPYDSIMEEAKLLVKNGAKEITLIAQDPTRYGMDFKDGDPRRLHNLLHDISQLDGLKWLRVLYLYPDEITPEVLSEIKNNDKIVKYFDIPIQHASDKILKAMNRRGSKALIKEHLDFVRKYIPGCILRTTVMTGFPGETKEDFDELVEFLKEAKFERLGCFSYSREENTPAYDMPNRVNKRTAESRANKIMEIQKEIALNFNKSLIGNEYECIIEGYDYDSYAYVGRNYMYAPDDVDGRIYIYSPVELQIGQFVKAKIVDCSEYDLYAELCREQ